MLPSLRTPGSALRREKHGRLFTEVYGLNRGDFVSDHHEHMLGGVAYLYFTNGQYAEAAKYLEKVLLIARRYEWALPVRIEWVWPRVILGECCWASGHNDKAAACWQSARSLEFCGLTEPEIDDWSRVALPWIERAKSRLAEHNIALPASEVSRKASDHLKQAIEHVIKAEQLEARGVDLARVSILECRSSQRSCLGRLFGRRTERKALPSTLF